ncbi:MAG TPA: hypothetical protein VFW40_01265 [Capsulimonadaceae bacterium]|nr:hypothetical protein [Capsulimonadaceae bacterium]
MASVSSVPAKKPRDLTRIIMWSLVGIAAAVLVYAYGAPTPPTGHTRAKRTSPTAAVASADLNAIQPEDLTAHFARYAGGKRDPFVPLIATVASNAAGKAGDQGQWLLTGISSINGIPSALVENSASGESAFLTVDEQWHGLKVKSIASDAVVFVNQLGQETRLAFASEAAPDQTAGAGASPPGNLPSASQVRPLPRIGNLPPLPIPTNNVPNNAVPAANQYAPTTPEPTPPEQAAQ